jgi:hypothetical protein
MSPIGRRHGGCGQHVERVGIAVEFSPLESAAAAAAPRR